MPASLLLETLALELQGAGVLGDHADDGVGGAFRKIGVDLEGQVDRCVLLGREVLDDLLGDAAGVAA
jgi:hypothetical protein